MTREPKRCPSSADLTSPRPLARVQGSVRASLCSDVGRSPNWRKLRMRRDMFSRPMTSEARVPRVILAVSLQSCCRLRGLPDEEKRGSWLNKHSYRDSKAKLTKEVTSDGSRHNCCLLRLHSGIYFHETGGRRERETQVSCSLRVFFPGCHWHTRWLRTPPAARSSPPCGLVLHGAKPSRGTSLNSHWHLREVNMSLGLFFFFFEFAESSQLKSSECFGKSCNCGKVKSTPIQCSDT